MGETTRSVRFVVVSSLLDSEAISEKLGMVPDNTRIWARKHPYQHTWELRSDGTTSDDVTGMISDIVTRLMPIQEQLRSMCGSEETACRMRIVMYIEDDALVKVGPGFAMSLEQVRFLATVGASIDADLYGVGSEEPVDSTESAG